MSGSYKRLVRNLRRIAELTDAERDALVHALHLHTTLHGAGVLTGRRLRRSTMVKLQKKNFAAHALLEVVDDDGFHVEPTRWRSGFVLTPAGLAAARLVVRQRDLLARGLAA